MLKSVFKEIIIVLLLLIILILLLGILFYDYMPNSKTVPAKVQEYALEETVKQELEENLNNKSEEIVKTYQLDSVDIEHYERTNEYNKGKVNPFAEYSTGTTDSTGDNTNTSSNQNTNTNTNTNTDNGNGSTDEEQDPSKDNFLGTTGK